MPAPITVCDDAMPRKSDSTSSTVRPPGSGMNDVTSSGSNTSQSSAT